MIFVNTNFLLYIYLFKMLLNYLFLRKNSKKKLIEFFITIYQQIYAKRKKRIVHIFWLREVYSIFWFIESS
jgi:hypothetical protein